MYVRHQLMSRCGKNIAQKRELSEVQCRLFSDRSSKFKEGLRYAKLG